MPPITELKIDRALWGMNALLNEDGTMCCLGHLSVACGVPKDKMAAGAVPGEHRGGIEYGFYKIGFPKASWREYGLPNWAMGHAHAQQLGNPIAYRNVIAATNDSDVWSDAEKEARLIELFRHGGITLSFYGEKDVGTVGVGK
jgi:hypothetical protein